MLLHVDGWLCEIKDVQIRDGLHILGQAPAGDVELDLVLAILRARQLFGGEQTVPGLREALGLAEDGNDERTGRRRRRGEAPANWWRRCRKPAGTPRRSTASLADPVVAGVLRFAAAEVVPRLRGTDGRDRPDAAGRWTAASSPSGPSGSPLRGLVNVLPTGRNFYSVDPKAVPSRLAWETGVALADSLLEPVPRRPRRLAALGRPVGVGHLGDAHLRRRHRRGARAARRAPGLG